MSDQALFQSFALGDLTLRNRIVLAPMTRARSGADRLANAINAKY
jgi:N-ethylmaleimide reductase